MRVLLDECLPRKLGRLLVGHEVTTVQQAGWAGVVNGQLLTCSSPVDRNLPAQQNTGRLTFGIIILRTPTNQLRDLEPLVPQILVALGNLQPGRIFVIPEKEPGAAWV